MTPVLELYPIAEKLGISKYIGSHEFSTKKKKNEIFKFFFRCRRARDRMVVEFTTTYVISDLWQIGGFLRELWFPPLIKLTI